MFAYLYNAIKADEQFSTERKESLNKEDISSILSTK